MSQPYEFTCRDCGTRVATFGAAHANEQDICARCLWLRDIEDPEEREKLRRLLTTQVEE